MGIRVGLPMLKLSDSGKQTKRLGDAKKILQEMGCERYSTDKSLDRARSKDNVYTGYRRGTDLYEEWMHEANEHRDALGRHLKKTAIVGYSGIFKPDIESMNKLTLDEQKHLLDVGTTVLTEIFQKHGLTVDMTATHFDEDVPHVHIAGHDHEYKCGKKIGLKLYHALNKEFPERMRAYGFDIEDMCIYDVEATKDMTSEELEEYKQKHIQKKKDKKTQVSSNEYKAAKELEKAQQQAEEILEAARQQAEQIIQSGYELNEQKANELSAREFDCAERESALKEREQRLEERESRDLTPVIQEYENKTEELKTALLSVKELKREYDNGKAMYDNIRYNIEGDGLAFSAKNAEETINLVLNETQNECEKVTFKSGKTLWSYVAKHITEIRRNVEMLSLPMNLQKHDEKIAVREQRIEEKKNIARRDVKIDVFSNKTNTDDDYSY